jgi:hypothetical protein
VVIAGCAGPAFQLWPKFTGAIVDPVEGLGLSLSFGSVLPAIAAISTIRPAQAVDRHAVRLVQASKILRRSARIKFDDEQFAALFNELQACGDKTKLMQLVRSLKHRRTFCAILVVDRAAPIDSGSALNRRSGLNPHCVV